MHDFLGLFALLILSTQKVLALETSYIRFQEPKGWNCQQEQTLWVCRSQDPIEMKESFLVVKAKLAGRTDNMHSFYESLKNPLPLINATGNNALSKVYSIEKTSISNKDWIKAVHLNSISQNYFTEYLVTIVGDLAIGIELNYHQTRYEKYKETLKQLTSTIRLIDNVASVNKQAPHKKTLQHNENQTTANNSNLPAWMSQSENLAPNKKLIIYFAIGILIITSLLFLRIKK